MYQQASPVVSLKEAQPKLLALCASRILYYNKIIVIHLTVSLFYAAVVAGNLMSLSRTLKYVMLFFRP